MSSSERMAVDIMPMAVATAVLVVRACASLAAVTVVVKRTAVAVAAKTNQLGWRW